MKHLVMLMENKTMGTDLRGDQVCEIRPYSKSEKVTLLLAVYRDPINPDMWYKI